MVIHVARCDYNVYDKKYTLEVDVHDPTMSLPTSTYTIELPENLASTESEFKLSVELFIRQRDRRINDWSGLSWNAVI